MYRHLTADAICKRCGTLESIDHLFIQCSFARNVWEAAPFVGTLDLSGSIDLNSVWLSLCDKVCLPPSGISTGHLAPWILWHIWTARNKLIFTGKVMSAEETLSQAIAQAREWLYSQDKHPGGAKKKTNRVTIPENCVRINIDAAWKVESKIAGLGWILTTQDGSSSFAEPVRSVGSALCAEALAMRTALRRCKELGFKRIVCLSDSSQLIQAVTSREPTPEIYGIVSDVFDVSCHFDVISFSWISRENNTAADGVAKLCLSEEEVFMAET